MFLIIDKSGLIDYEGGSERLWNISAALNLLLDCGRLFFSGIFIFYLYEIIKNKLYLILISLLLIFLSCIGNFKIFLFFPAVLLLFVALEIFIHDKPFETQNDPRLLREWPSVRISYCCPSCFSPGAPL